MKTVTDLNRLIPVLVELLRNNDHEIGETFFEDYGYCEESATNCLYYEEDGWEIEIEYTCTGEWLCEGGDYWNPPCTELIRARGNVESICAYHYDEESGEDTVFSDADLKALRRALDKELADIPV